MVKIERFIKRIKIDNFMVTLEEATNIFRGNQSFEEKVGVIDPIARPISELYPLLDSVRDGELKIDEIVIGSSGENAYIITTEFPEKSEVPIYNFFKVHHTRLSIDPKERARAIKKELSKRGIDYFCMPTRTFLEVIYVCMEKVEDKKSIN